MQLPVSYSRNLFYDGQTIDQKDLQDEQKFYSQTLAALINNQIGTGVLPENLTDKIIFDSDNLSAGQASLLAAGEFDGSGISAHTQPSDIITGNQLAINLSNSLVLGRQSIKVAIIGIGFDDSLQIERFYFYRNEIQVTKKHYKQVLSILFNDFKGNNLCSKILGGRIVIFEATNFLLSKDVLTVSQDIQPNIFWRDWKLPNISVSLQEVLQSAIGTTYSVDSLEIEISGLDSQQLVPDEVTLQVGQKFYNKINNLQKITILLSTVFNSAASPGEEFDWSGDLVFTLYPLQTTINCPNNLVPELAIDFEPSPQSIGQITFNQESLKKSGYVLTDILQPIDFVFSNSKLGQFGGINENQYYVFTIKRNGDASIGTINIGVGKNSDTSTRLTLYNSVWVDIPEQSLWFQVWSDSLKISDGQGYSQGLGLSVPKTAINPNTAILEDFYLGLKSLSTTGQNQTNYAIIEATNIPTDKIQNERTGSPQFSKQQYQPNFQLLSSTNYQNLISIQDTLILGCAADTNPRKNILIENIQNIPGLVKGKLFKIIDPDPELISANLLGSSLIPNSENTELAFRVIKSNLCQNKYGDVNGDGVIDFTDLNRLSELLGESLNLSSTQSKIINNEIDTLELLRADVNGDGYVTSEDFDLLSQYLTRSINSFPIGSSFNNLELEVENLIGRWDDFYQCHDGYARLDGYNSLNVIDINNLTGYEQEWFGVKSDPELSNDIIFSTVPFSPVIFLIEPIKTWRPEWLLVSPKVKLLSAVFAKDSNEIALTNLCNETHPQSPECATSKNNYFFPGDLNFNGELLKSNGDFYAVDLEIAQFILELPVETLLTKHLDIFTKLVYHQNDGLTSAGFPALKYADGTFVKLEDLSSGKIRFSAAIQSLYLISDGYFSDGYDIQIDYWLGLNIDPITGLLTLETRGLNSDSSNAALRAKVLITVFLKQAGWQNSTLTLNSSELSGLLFD